MRLKKVIVALDFSIEKDLWNFVEKLDPKLCMVKVGSQLFLSLGHNVIKKLQNLGFDIFLDLKFYDIPNTVACACKSAADLGVQMITVHTSGGFEMLLAARQSLDSINTSNNKPILLGVTVLTSMDDAIYEKVGIYSHTVTKSVEILAKLAFDAGFDGIVSSAFEVPIVKKHNLLAITPGIRLNSTNLEDQKRVVTPEEAFNMGSDYIVIGRPLYNLSNPMSYIIALA